MGQHGGVTPSSCLDSHLSCHEPSLGPSTPKTLGSPCRQSIAGPALHLATLLRRDHKGRGEARSATTAAPSSSMRTQLPRACITAIGSVAAPRAPGSWERAAAGVVARLAYPRRARRTAKENPTYRACRRGREVGPT